MNETYIGDGVYAKYDGYRVELYTQRESDRHWIYLEPEVLKALNTWVDKFTKPVTQLVDPVRTGE